MIPPEMLAEMHQRIASAQAPLISVVVRCGEMARRTNAIVDMLIERVGASEAAREEASTERHRRVIDAFRRRDYANLSFKDRRYAAKQFELATPPEMQGLLERHPACWETFANACLTNYERFTLHSERANYVNLLDRGAPHVGLFRSNPRPPILFSNEGPGKLARLVDAPNLSAALQDLQTRGFSSRWQFTAFALAAWVNWRVYEKGEVATNLWAALTSNLLVESILLPRPAESNRSWFAATPRPANVKASVYAQASFVSALFRAPHLDRHWGELMDRLLSSEFGDPRIPPESFGWKSFKQLDAKGYDWFLEFLITQDLQVFFQYAMTDMRRERFWKRYLKSIRRTVCVLDKVKHEQIKKVLGATDPKLAGAMSRAKTFTRQAPSQGAQAFVLYFDSHVIVEFSESGNASYVYERATFETQFGREVRLGGIPNHSALKMKSAAHGRILHVGDWETKAEDVLLKLGIQPNR